MCLSVPALERLSDVKLTVEEIAVTRAAQMLKLKVVLEAVNQKLGIQDEASCKWSIKRERERS